MANSGSAAVSCLPPPSLDYTIASRNGSQWTGLYSWVCNIKEESKRCADVLHPTRPESSNLVTTFLSEALAASSVKISGRDVLASWKVLIALAVTPILYAFYAILATVIAARAQAPLKWTLSMPFLVLVALPVMNLAALKFGEAGMDVLKFVSLSCDNLPPLITFSGRFLHS